MNTTKITYEDIMNITETDAKHLSIPNGGEIIPDIKGHTLYLCDLRGHFGYSCLVFCEGHHIRYADDFQLHHPKKTIDQLHDYYIVHLRDHVLFDESEIGSPLKSYTEFKARERFLINYYGMRRDYVSLFGSDGHPTDSIYDHVNCAYYANKDRKFVFRHAHLYIDLCNALEETKNDLDFWVDAFRYEMGNHEYHINWTADFDTLGAFGNLHYYEECQVEEYFDQLHFTATQRKAYYIARNRYYEECDF